MTVAIGRAATELTELLLEAGRDDEAPKRPRPDSGVRRVTTRCSLPASGRYARTARASNRPWQDTEEALGHDERLRALHEDLVGQAGS
jgi:hypothetical protein